MTTTDLSVPAVFADADAMYAAALERLATDDIRDAADKAWCAALQATNALILARTGELPTGARRTTHSLQAMAAADPPVRSLRSRYFALQASLHDNCFSMGWCEPVEDIELLIHETSDYIADARRLATA